MLGFGQEIRQKLPWRLRQIIRSIDKTFNRDLLRKRANITEATGQLPLDSGTVTLVVAVTESFDQTKPNAMMTCRIGYCRAFEELGVPYVISDVADLADLLPSLPNPFCCIFGADFSMIGKRTVQMLRKYPHFVWVDPWFKGSEKFFAHHCLRAETWTWPDSHRRRILESEPSFVFTATVETGLCFFEEWEKHGVHLISLPLACDTTLYNPLAPYCREFEDIRMAFVGGYWESKGRQIDTYLRPFEDELVIFGYNEWPYRGYRGKLSRAAEPSLYRQALICPTINEPTVRLLHGQINERVFKVLGCGGVTVVDAVPAYRELFSEDELTIPKDEHEFAYIVRELLVNRELRDQYSSRGYEAVVSRHTYMHRAKEILQELGLDINNGRKNV